MYREAPEKHNSKKEKGGCPAKLFQMVMVTTLVPLMSSSVPVILSR